MNHLCAKQRLHDGRWDYTRNGFPTGYCHKYKRLFESGGVLPPEVAQRENERMEPFVSKFHDDGHETAEEARECYKQYLLDTRLHLVTEEPENASQQHRCQICQKFTGCHASAGPYRLFTLCPEHQTREHVASLLEVYESWES